ncbi:unnamed protein product [Caenorhabditis sp. 36 PRJEB53466]|nr:unnamed protein product [Caenorhabditis sp. 36 PRJEB53466]
MSPSRPSCSKKPKRVIKQEETSEEEFSIEDESSAEDESAVETCDGQQDDFEIKTTLSRRKRTTPGPLSYEQYSRLHFKKDKESGYMPYVPGRWTPQSIYRLPSDVVLDTIRRTGTEGMGRYEIGQVIGYDATVKTGGRKVTNFIANCTNEHPDHVGQFQKMNGKVRTIRYYWKESEQPEKFEKLLLEFEALSGQTCPFKIGEVLKFPEKKLNTLRISDVTLKRLNRLLTMVNEHRVIVTINRVIKKIFEEELAEGYKFQIDKKSVMKCLLALKSKGLISVWETTVRSDNVDYQIQVVGHKSIKKVDDPEVYKAIATILDSYHKEGRVFPHGQFRVLKKRNEVTGPTEFEEKVEEIDEDVSKSRTVKDRYHFFRVQVLRNSWKGKNIKDEEEEETGETHKEEPDETILDETVEEDPNQAMVNLFAKSPAVSNPQKRSSMYYFGRDSLGYQAKAIRLHVLHEIAFHFVHGFSGSEQLKKSSVFNLFPPAQAFDTWPVKDEATAEVFLDEESPYRFMPSQPKYDGVDQGWFMVQDFLAAMPLSIFVLTNYVPRKIDRFLLQTFLKDPIKRHLCLGYLPVEVREVLMKEKKIHKQLEHAFLLLGAMGLAAVGPNPSVKRFPGASSSMFFIAKRAHLVDTSSSAKGYACVNPPIEIGNYQKYEYEFTTRDEITLYWHHLRAIVQSTPLSYRSDDFGEQRCATRHKLFSIGVFDKKVVERQHVDVSRTLSPNTLRDGVAGFDSALFLHLKRHWELLTAPHLIVSWFVTKFRKCSEVMKPIIEKKVRVLQRDWNNFMRLTLTDSDAMKNSNSLNVECPPKVKKNFRSFKTKSKEKKLLRNPKKRKPDSVDLVSSSSRISVRCRFSPKERDQLIMIRAVGFFLNPVYRFWLDPTVLRDLMHEFVPESRNKTVQSLMACGVRELVRSNRLAYLQRVVRNLSTFPEMRRLRSELCSTPVSPTQSKTEFFKDAFRTAMRLLFVDNDRIPHTSISDASFKQFLISGNVSVTKENAVSNSLPYRSQKPFTIGHIQHCVTSNVLLSVLIHSENSEFAEKVLDQIPPAVLQSVLQSLRTDGLVSRSRTAEAMADLANKNHATLSYYFRHFFSHRFHSDLIEGTGRLMAEYEDDASPDTLELVGDMPEVVVAATSTFYSSKCTLDMRVDDDILEAFSKMDKDQTVKKIRYLESTDLHFEKVHVIIEKTGENSDQEDMLDEIVKFLDKSRVVQEKPLIDDWIRRFEGPIRRQIRAVLLVIKASKAAGVTIKEISSMVKFPLERIPIILKDLNDNQYILECGVDERRLVSSEYEAAWNITVNDRKWCPRPWLSPEGTISLPAVRWIAESVLLLIVGKLGIQLEDLLFTYEFAMQPIAIREMADLLEKLGCIQFVHKTFMSSKLSSPFSKSSTSQSITYIHPTVDALERFSKIFHGVALLPTMTSKPN